MTPQRWQVQHGDCLELMRSLPDGSVSAVVTDPPYGLSFMGKRWDYDVPSVEIWAEALRVLKPGGHLLAFAGTRTQHRMAVRIEDAGFEIRDMIAWVYGSGFPKSHNLKGDWEGWGTALKPSLEPITVARKPFKGAVAQNVAEHGTGALNIEACRVGESGGRTNHTKSNGVHRDRWEGNTSTGDVSFHGGRWPANLLHDGSPEVVELFPETGVSQGGSRGAGGTNGKYGLIGAQPELGELGYGDTGSAARFFYCAKADRAEREEGLSGQPLRAPSQKYGLGAVEGNPKKPADCTALEPRANHHPTVKPVDLMRWLCRLVTPPGGLVLDPFTGSGSTGVACGVEGFRFLGMEREGQYVEIARRRIEAAYAQGKLDLFGGDQ